MNPLSQLAIDELEKHRAAGHAGWDGYLSSSALATALAGTVLEDDRAADWLLANQNADGGWGDSPESPSNIPTTLIARAFLRLRNKLPGNTDTWLRAQNLPSEPAELIRFIPTLYGKDRTFSVPITVYLATIEERLNPDTAQKCWRATLPLPFFLAVLPRKFFSALRLHVVSYALPALIAIGYCRHRHTARIPFGRLLEKKLFKLLADLQPESGGFLEAAPLTGFVALCLDDGNPVKEKCRAFLKNTQREDGSWPIDTNLSQWVTALAVRALRLNHQRVDDSVLDFMESNALKTVHPFTASAPGGFKWTHCSGGVPDADDTAAAMIAIVHAIARKPCHIPLYQDTLKKALVWLLNLQNADGGLPTFCRGWGHLPFDKSCPDITAHAMEAIILVCDLLQLEVPDEPIQRMIGFLRSSQNPDGSWTPLWFGSQQRPDKTNPVFGTARVLISARYFREAHELLDRGREWLMKNPGRTQEELALSAIALNDENLARKLLEDIRTNGFKAAPIGLYFSALWYSERLYPVVWALEAGTLLSTD